MSVKTVTSETRRRNYRYDAEKKIWIGYQIDVRVWTSTGRSDRHRTVFPTRRAAETAETALKIKSREKQLGIYAGDDADGDDKQKITVSQLFEKRLELINSNNEKTRARRVFAFFENLLTVEYVKDVRTADFNEFNLRREQSGVKRETVNRDLTVLITTFHQAHLLFKELADYQAPVMRRPKFKSARRTRVITEQEKNLICQTLREPRKFNETTRRFTSRHVIAQMFEIGWLLGLRFSEILRSEKKNFDARQKTWKVMRWKTGKLETLEFLPVAAVRILSLAAKTSGTEFIFNLTCSRNTVYNILRSACERNKILYGREHLDGVTFHATRHSFTTRLVEVTDIATAQSYTSHADGTMVLYYSHASRESRKRAMEKLYPDENKFSDANLRLIFNKIKDKRMDFAKFQKLIKNLIPDD